MFQAAIELQLFEFSTQFAFIDFKYAPKFLSNFCSRFGFHFMSHNHDLQELQSVYLEHWNGNKTYPIETAVYASR